MSRDKTFDFIVDKDSLTITVKRFFDAPRDLIWSAWTEAELLDRWWGPKPWRAETKSMDFSAGGRWLYAMVGPEGERHWDLITYLKIAPRESFAWHSVFCDENGVPGPDATGATWTNTFTERDGGTLVTNVIVSESAEHLEIHLKMGFEEGYTAGLNQLEELAADLRAKGG